MLDMLGRYKMFSSSSSLVIIPCLPTLTLLLACGDVYSTVSYKKITYVSLPLVVSTAWKALVWETSITMIMIIVPDNNEYKFTSKIVIIYMLCYVNC